MEKLTRVQKGRKGRHRGSKGEVHFKEVLPDALCIPVMRQWWECVAVTWSVTEMGQSRDHEFKHPFQKANREGKEETGNSTKGSWIQEETCTLTHSPLHAHLWTGATVEWVANKMCSIWGNATTGRAASPSKWEVKSDLGVGKCVGGAPDGETLRKKQDGFSSRTMRKPCRELLWREQQQNEKAIGENRSVGARLGGSLL